MCDGFWGFWPESGLDNRVFSMKLSMKCVLCGLVAASAFLSACSSMIVPTVVLRRMNDVGVTYVADTQQAEAAVLAAISEIGGQYRFTDRFSANGAATVHGMFDRGFNNKPTPTRFEIDIDPVRGHSDWRKIRIGIGDFGNNEVATRFQRILMSKLSVVNSEIPSRNAEKLRTGSVTMQTSESVKVIREESLTPATGSVSYHSPVVPSGANAPAASNANAIPQSVLQYYE